MSLTWLLSIVTFPWDLFKWLWNVVKVAELRIKLEGERRRLQDLRRLKDLQLEDLRSSNTQYLRWRVEQVRPNIGNNAAEPDITIQVDIFNGSMFEMRLQNPKLSTELDGNRLTLPSADASGSLFMYPGNITTLVFSQPIQPQTKDRLNSAIERHDRVSWKIRLEADYTIKDTGESSRFRPHQIERTEIPFLV